MSMFRLGKWLCHCNGFALFYVLVQLVAPLMFAVAIDTTTSFRLGMQCRLVLSLCFLDVYGLNLKQFVCHEYIFLLLQKK